ncbi:Flp family type IVb pilin [Arthrobacter rhizosphaerae]|uniref:Flp family type IVb pilin n=1 Tax=Arthrobacter rhizosphaerae TaxID=2855490 RepID=UPI001FF62307|nr:Flp family type IVb pilin [Arthrobacter rhizosphaerae]
MTSLMVSMMAFIAGVKDRLASEKGATATEYSLLIAFIAFLIIVGVTAFGTALNTWFSDLGVEVGTWDAP